MNKEVSLKSDLKIFNIDIDDIEFNPHFFEVLQKIIDVINTNAINVEKEAIGYLIHLYQ